jgi:hypothetical protein
MFCPKCGKELPEGAIYLYCPECGERLATPPPALPVTTIETKRPGTITAAAIICGVLGGFNILAAIFILISSALLSGTSQPLPELPPFGSASVGLLIGLGILSLIFGALYGLACWQLWDCKKSGGILGIILGALGLISSFIPPTGFSFVAMLPDIAIIILIALGWRSLT